AACSRVRAACLTKTKGINSIRRSLHCSKCCFDAFSGAAPGLAQSRAGRIHGPLAPRGTLSGCGSALEQRLAADASLRLRPSGRPGIPTLEHADPPHAEAEGWAGRAFDAGTGEP